MNHVTIGDGCSIQNSVICSNVQLQDRVALRDCQVIIISNLSSFSPLPLLSHASGWYLIIHFFAYQVGAGFVVSAGSECKGEALAKKEKWVRASPWLGNEYGKAFRPCASIDWNRFCWLIAISARWYRWQELRKRISESRV